MAVALDFTSMLSVVGPSLGATVAAVLAVAASVLALLVALAGIRHVVAMIRGEHFYGGRYWDRETWDDAMQSLSEARKQGISIDSDSRRHHDQWRFDRL